MEATPVTESSNELVKWLQMLSLPRWARYMLLVVVCFIFAGGVFLLGLGIFKGDNEYIGNSMGILTIGLPVMLLVLALVFGQQGEKRLLDATHELLSHNVPQALLRNMQHKNSRCTVDTECSGCIGEYHVHLHAPHMQQPVSCRFSVEVNVRKVNLAVWLDAVSFPEKIAVDAPELEAFKHVFSGAISEGYTLNTVPVHYAGSGKGKGVLFFRELGADFLLKPADRLYFCQDLSFFIRGVLEALHEIRNEQTQ